MLCTDGDMLCNYHINVNIFLHDCSFHGTTKKIAKEFMSS